VLRKQRLQASEPFNPTMQNRPTLFLTKKAHSTWATDSSPRCMKSIRSSVLVVPRRCEFLR
jgi:hypothetical protein